MADLGNMFRYIVECIPPGVSCACGSNRGKKRANNEDNFCFDGTCLPEDGSLEGVVITTKISRLNLAEGNPHGFGIFDGMGGGDYGEVASRTAARAMKEFLEQAVEESFEGTETDEEEENRQLLSFCEEANQKVHRIGADLGSPMMGTTLAVLYLKKNSLWVCNIGDSRIFRLRDHLMEQVSVDHTDEKEMKAAGISGRKPVLTQYVGIDPEVYVLEPYISWKKIRKKDVYLICSDGVTDMVPESDIREILDSQMKPKGMVEKLIHSALDGGGRDNITATVLVFG